jgi:transposase
MVIDQEYINKLSELSNEVLKDKSLSPAARLLIQTLLMTTQLLFTELQKANGEIAALKERVRELELMVNKDSHNSHLPPSSDRRKRYPKKDKKSRNSSGGQKGHKGSTLRTSANPDQKVEHKLKGNCNRCGTWLPSIDKKAPLKRQVFDIEFQVKVTEHEAESGICGCGKKHTAQFPEGVNAHVQYGSAVRALVNYLSSYQMIPFDRLEEIFKDLFKLDLCEGTIFNTNQASFKKLQSFEKKIKEALLNSDINHADETPIKVAKKQSYLHVLSNEAMTLIVPHASRGMKAVNEIGVLPNYEGILCSDFFNMYYTCYYVKNASCHSHLSRELTLLEEEFKLRWAHELRRFFLDLNDYMDEYRDENKPLPADEKQIFYEEFKRIILKAKIETADWNQSGKKTVAANLLARIIRHETSVLRFMNDHRVPFTNNLAERDLRMAKVRQKVSGCFRSIEGAKIYARLRSYLSTVKKQGRNVWEALKILHLYKNPRYIELFT